MAQASFRIAGRTLEMFGPRAEQIAHLLELDRSEAAAKLAERIGEMDMPEDVAAQRGRSLGA